MSRLQPQRTVRRARATQMNIYLLKRRTEMAEAKRKLNIDEVLDLVVEARKCHEMLSCTYDSGYDYVVTSNNLDEIETFIRDTIREAMKVGVCICKQEKS
jgi:hypothetical protein